MRVKHKVNVTITDDAEGKDKLLSLDDTAAEVALDGYEEHSSGKAKLAIGASFSVPFGSVGDARGFFLKSTGDCDVSINGGAALQVRRGLVSSGTRAASTKLFFEGTLLSVTVTAVEALSLTHAVWGDPVA